MKNLEYLGASELSATELKENSGGFPWVLFFLASGYIGGLETGALIGFFLIRRKF